MKRWLVDGMNLVGTRPDGWWNDPDAAMGRITAQLDAFVRNTGQEVTVVFDREPRAPLEARFAEVVFARWKGRNAADHEIEEIVAADPEPSGFLVVTSDKRLADKVRELGASVVGSGRFRSQIEGAVEED